jgi:hypothetical protein
MEKAWAFYRDENGEYKDTAYWQKNTWKIHLHDDFKSLGLTVEQDKNVADFQGSTTHHRGVELLNTIKTALMNHKSAYMTGTLSLR